MKNILPLFGTLCLAGALMAGASSCSSSELEGKARFVEFEYTGNDKFYNENPLDGSNFYNPILQGFYPDPSITRKGNDYYMVCSSFSYFPGVPIFHSTDLVNWKQIGHVLDRPSQLPIKDLPVSNGIFAPCIKYNQHNDTFYMITTLVGGPEGCNFFVKTKDPKSGGWSEPVKLPEVGGIDPSFFFDEDGKAYIVHNDAPDGEPLYEGHRAVRMWEFDTATEKVTGGGKVMVNGGVNLAEKPIWIEAPHIYKRNGAYYLMCAEGGTSVWHSEVIFKSDKVDGPYIPAKNNPILTQRYFNGPRDYEVTCAGHADIVSTPDGGHYGVFLACRPYPGGKYNTGRETFILPVDWTGDFPAFVGGLEPIRLTQALPQGVENKTGTEGYMPNGNFTYRDMFDKEELDMRWIMIRTPYEPFTQTGKTRLVMTPKPVNIRQKDNPSFIGYRQQHITFTAKTILLEYEPETEKDFAGIVCFQREEFNYVFGVTNIDGKKCMVLEKTVNGKAEMVASKEIKETMSKLITLQVDGDGANYSFSYSTDGKQFESLGQNLDGTILSTDVAGGFVGCVIGLYATSARETI